MFKIGDRLTDWSLVDDKGTSFIGEVGEKDGKLIFVRTNCDCGDCVGSEITGNYTLLPKVEE